MTDAVAAPQNSEMSETLTEPEETVVTEITEETTPAGPDTDAVYTTTSTVADDAETAPSIVPAVAAPVAFDRPVQTVGRRKEAVVRVRLMPGTGKFTLNGRTMDGYFPNKVHQQLIREPLVTLEKAESYDIYATLHGGGVTGQAGALRLGIARALIEIDENDRPAMKKAGFLTRDARAKERKKYGLKKARKAPQYSKR